MIATDVISCLNILHGGTLDELVKSKMSIDGLTTVSKESVNHGSSVVWKAGMYGRGPQIKSPARQFFFN